jgi:uncharacterized coiled-coil protein SlyX
MDLFGKKAQARAAELEAKLAQAERTVATLQSDLSNKDTELLQEKRTSALYQEQKETATRRCFNAEDLVTEFLGSTIPKSDLRERARRFIAGDLVSTSTRDKY